MLRTTDAVQAPVRVVGSAFARLAGLERLHVPCNARPAALTDLVGGQVLMMLVDMAAGLPLVKAGKLRVLRATAASRSALLRGVPAIAEALPGCEGVGCTAMVAPAATQPEVVRRIQLKIEKILTQPVMRTESERVGFEPRTASPEETEALIRTERDQCAQRVKAVGIESE